MARQTKTAEFFNPNVLTSLADFVTEFIALIVENILGATGRYIFISKFAKERLIDIYSKTIFRKLGRCSEQTRGHKEGEAQGGAGGGGAQTQRVHQGCGGRHDLTRLRPLQEL